MGALEDGTDRSEAKAEQGDLEAMAGSLRGRGLVPRPGHYNRNPSTPRKKNRWGNLRAIRSPPWLSTGTGALTGLSLETEVLTGHDGSTTALLGLDVESGALTGLAPETASIEATLEAGG